MEISEENHCTTYLVTLYYPYSGQRRGLAVQPHGAEPRREGGHQQRQLEQRCRVHPKHIPIHQQSRVNATTTTTAAATAIAAGLNHRLIDYADQVS